jgi:hypothetical protein
MTLRALYELPGRKCADPEDAEFAPPEPDELTDPGWDHEEINKKTKKPKNFLIHQIHKA